MSIKFGYFKPKRTSTVHVSTIESRMSMNPPFNHVVIMLFATLISTFSVCFSSALHAKEFDIAIESYASIPEKSMFAMSPSGDRVGYRSANGGRDAYVIVDLKANKMIAGLDVSAIDPQRAYFVNESQLIFVASKFTEIPGYTGKYRVSSAFVYDTDTKEIRQLVVPGKGVFDGQSRLGRIIGVSPDQEYVYMPLLVKRGERSKAVYSLTKVSLNKKRTPQVISLGTSDTIDFFMGNDGQVLARERYNNDTNIHAIEKWVDDKWVEVFSEEVPIRVRSFVGVTADKKSLVSLSNYKNQDAYFTMSLDTGEISEPLFYDKTKSVASVMSDINRVVFGVRYDGFKPSYGFFDTKQEQLLTSLQKAMPENTFRLTHQNSDWSKILLYVEGNGMSGNYLIYEGGKFSALTSARPQIPGEMVHPIVETSYAARDGLNIPVLLTYPKSKLGKSKNLPAIMMPHGGPESYDKFGFNYMAQFFANKGYLVIQPQFRGSDGFGWAHKLAGRGKWGQEMQTDLTDGVKYLVEKGEVDPNRVCIVGASYGGYAAFAGTVFSPDVYKCAIAINGVSDLELMLEDEEFDAGDDHWVVAYWNRVIRSGDVSDTFLNDVSPINHVDKVSVPVLIIAGRDDKVVPYYQSRNMNTALKRADKDVTYKLIRDVGHHFRQADSRKKLLKEIDGFINEHL